MSTHPASLAESEKVATTVRATATRKVRSRGVLCALIVGAVVLTSATWLHFKSQQRDISWEHWVGDESRWIQLLASQGKVRAVVLVADAAACHPENGLLGHMIEFYQHNCSIMRPWSWIHAREQKYSNIGTLERWTFQFPIPHATILAVALLTGLPILIIKQRLIRNLARGAVRELRRREDEPRRRPALGVRMLRWCSAICILLCGLFFFGWLGMGFDGFWTLLEKGLAKAQSSKWSSLHAEVANVPFENSALGPKPYDPNEFIDLSWLILGRSADSEGRYAIARHGWILLVASEKPASRVRRSHRDDPGFMNIRVGGSLKKEVVLGYHWIQDGREPRLRGGCGNYRGDEYQIIQGTFDTRPATLARSAKLTVLAIPVASTLAILAIIPTLLFVAGPLRRAVINFKYRCPQCDYDLRGLESAQCPECGTPRMSPGKGQRQ